MGWQKNVNNFFVNPFILILHGEKTIKTSKILSRNSLRFITLLVLSSVSFTSFTAIAQTDPEIIDACKATLPKTKPERIADAYKVALKDSIETEPEEKEITKNLAIIDNFKSNPNLYLDTQGRVLVVTFTDTKNPHFTNKETPNFDVSNSNGIWVTVAPKLKSFCSCYTKQNQNISTAEDLNLRIEQLLGIIPESGKTHIVELWVDPDFLHRPMNLDNISQSEPEDFVSWLQNYPVSERKKLVQDLQQDKTSSELAEKYYPWTGLGYTFDWASKLDSSIKEFGLSEFIIWRTKEQISSSGKVPAVEFNRAFTTEEYCKPDNSL